MSFNYEKEGTREITTGEGILSREGDDTGITVLLSALMLGD